MAPRKQKRNLQQYRRFRPQNKNSLTKAAKKFFGLILVCFSFFSVMFIGYKSLASSSVFYAINLQVDGLERLSKDQVLELGEIGIHSNLLAVDPETVKRRIEAHDWVERVRVTRKLPDVLNIVVRERKPVATINFDEGLFYIDNRGTAFSRVMKGDDYDYPVITGLPNGPMESPEVKMQIHEALSFLRYASRGDSRLPKQNVSEINLADPNNIIVYLVDRPFPIFLGRGEMYKKYKRLARVLYKLYKREVFENTAYIRMDYADHKVLVGKVEPTGNG